MKFHISLPCSDVDATRNFYENELGFTVGRSSFYWVDVNLYGNQITFTLDTKPLTQPNQYSFEEVMLPTFHFGVILEESEWQMMYEKFRDREFASIDKTEFLLNRKGQHKSFFLRDVNGYFIEFKCFKNPSEIFATDEL